MPVGMDKLVTNGAGHMTATAGLPSVKIDIKEEQETEPGYKSAQKTAGSCSGGASSHKMGSRRIFTPQFKLQVLESYRNDNDCKGNQRATARKYNIHRRQIQKWLQCESSLRSSVANISQNTVKHQFHNISMHHQHPHKPTIPNGPLIGVTYGADCQLSSQSVVSALSTCVATSMSEAQGVLSPVSLAAVVASATDSIAVTNALGGRLPAGDPISSPLHTRSVVEVGHHGAVAMSPLLHNHHYGIPTYIHTPANAQLSVPILTHHISRPPHLHQQSQQYHYHNLAYAHALTQQANKQQSSYLPPRSLPDINALSANASAATSTDNSLTVPVDGAELTSAKTGSITNESNGSEQIYERYIRNVCGGDSRKAQQLGETHNALFEMKGTIYPAHLYPVLPMDLSLRPRHGKDINCVHAHISQTHGKHDDVASIIDLTHRKRKGSASSAMVAIPENSSTLCEKQPKISSSVPDSSDEWTVDVNSEDEEVDIEVGTEEKQTTSNKPVKLFKPYLLDEEEVDNIKCSTSCESTSPWTSYASNTPPPQHCHDSLKGENSGGPFQSAAKDAEGASFHSESKSAFTSVPTASPTFFRCPKGSPASSGYESSSSTYSDSSFSSRTECFEYARTYTINLQMRSIHNDNMNLHIANQVERWLEQEL